tara:strand:+ start:336 stop:596 length:261 start_codon:yes stop_codon:yes gene_type:complete
MDKKEKYYNYVVNDLVKKTEIDYDEGRIYTPFSPPLVLLSFTFFTPSLDSFFSDHCKGVYGVNDGEIKYVWDEYKEIIKDKIRNNG